ncbi:MAG: hypothetical protein HPY58_10600 [Firmicutes bacterium]|nr:hypothetical protein [Bacillota bacterium]
MHPGTDIANALIAGYAAKNAETGGGIWLGWHEQTSKKIQTKVKNKY